MDLDSPRDRLPGLACAVGDVPFLADDRSLDGLSFSVDALLQHRRALGLRAPG